MRKAALAAVALAFILAGPAAADEKSAKGLVDADFVAKATSSNLAEIAMNKAALEKSKDEKIKAFAEKLIKDHTAANEKLAATAKEVSIAVPSSMMPEHEKHVKMLQDAGADFDAVYTKHMVEGHTKSVEMFTAASKELKEEKLRGFAEKTLPTLKEHLAGAKKLADEHGTKK